MSLFKCKMCGGALEINNNETVATCEYCGTQQTLPKLDDDRRVNLYDRANHFRRNNEFDKAMGIYEQILNEDNTDAEAYWSLVLCRYGIEYVEDPSSHKRIPTVNRAQFTSIFDDDNYKSALQYADSYQRHIYEEEAKSINEIQKGILAISQKEEPFDVFICYKETDNNGRRTPDSVLAQDLYYQLNQEGFKVFFARITLEDKLGSAYEPYIFAALNSAKVMVVLGTKPEFFNAVWVKNEWSRYLGLIKQGQKKMLIPAYKDMDPYDLPEEFSHLQAQDMSKLGFMQDLIRGIKKIAQTEEPKATVVIPTVVPESAANVAPLLKRAFMFLEDGDWDSANEYCEKVLDLDPECAEAYLGKLMVELKVKERENLNQCKSPFTESNHYKKVMRFADEALKAELNGYLDEINDKLSDEQKMAKYGATYSQAEDLASQAISEETYEKAAQLFESLGEYQDAPERAKNCRKMAVLQEKAFVISSAVQEYGKSNAQRVQKESDLAVTTAQIENLETLKVQFAKFEEEKNCILDEHTLLRGETAKLNSEKASLGLFAGKRKAELRNQIAEINSRIGTLNQKLVDLDKKQGGYGSEADLDVKIRNLQQKAAELQTQLQNLHSDAKSTILEDAYQEATKLREQGSLLEAYNLFRLLKGYRDSKKQLSKFGVLYDKCITLSDGKTVFTSVNKYNDLQKAESSVYAYEGSDPLTTTYKYDSCGNQISETHSSEISTKTFTFQYDEQGNIIARTVEMSSDAYCYTSTITFDAEGRTLSKTSSSNEEKEKKSVYKHEYDEEGNRTESCMDCETKEINLHALYDNKGNILKSFGDSEEVYTSCTYDVFSNCIKEIGKGIYPGNYQKKSWYNEYGLCVRSRTEKEDGTCEEETNVYFGLRVVYYG